MENEYNLNSLYIDFLQSLALQILIGLALDQIVEVVKLWRWLQQKV